jgi:type 1 glutamine amidotransferase
MVFRRRDFISTAALGVFAHEVVCAVPGAGPIGLRDQVAYQVVQGRTLETALAEMNVAPADRAQAEEYYHELMAPLPKPSEDEPRALVMIGDFYHHPAKSREPLEAMLRKSGFHPQFLYDVKQLSADSLRGRQLLLVLRDGMLRPAPGADPVWWLTGEQEKALASFVESGGGYLALHCATALRWFGDKPCLYRDLLGSSNRGHGEENERFEVRVVAPDHPITQGVHDFTVVDQHHRPGLFADNLTVLLRTSGDNVHGYARSYGKGRVCYLANGHHREVLESEPMQRLMSNASRWCVQA